MAAQRLGVVVRGLSGRAPVLSGTARPGLVPVYGLNYKDQRPCPGLAQEFGDPYTLSIADLEGRVGIDYGVYGVPETSVIDRDGVIRYKQIDPITGEILQKKIIPLVKELQQ